MLLSKAEITGFVIAIIGVAIMGVLAFTGPFHKINKIRANALPAVRVKIVPNKVTIGGYNPNIITVHAGQTIQFTNASSLDHTVTAQDDSFNSNTITSGSSWNFTPTTVGSFSFVCSYHPLMRGTIVVLG